MTFWVVPPEAKGALQWESLQHHGLAVTAVSPRTNAWRDTLATFRAFLKTYSWGRTNAVSRHRGWDRIAAGLVAESTE